MATILKVVRNLFQNSHCITYKPFIVRYGVIALHNLADSYLSSVGEFCHSSFKP